MHGRCTVGRIVDYVQEPLKKPGLNMNPLRPVPRETTVVVRYADDADRVGTIDAVDKK